MSIFVLALTVGVLQPAFAAPRDQTEDPRGVLSSVQAHSGELATCYGAALQTDPKAGGLATVRLQVGISGYVESASLAGSPLSPSTNACVLGVLTSVTFPDLVGEGATIVVPFDFSSR